MNVNLRITKLFVFLMMCLGGSTLVAQQQIISHMKMVENHDSTAINFHLYPFESNWLDLSELKSHHPQWEGPDSLRVVLPKMKNQRDTHFLVGILNSEVPTIDDLVIIVTCNYHSNEVTFYIDKTLDRNFRNDGRPMVLKGGEIRAFRFYPNNDSRLEKEIILKVEQNPLFVKRRPMRRIRNRLAIAGFIGMSVGGLKYKYDNLETGYPVWYDVATTGRNFGLNLSFETDRFRIGANVTYQNFYYWASHLNIRRGEPYKVSTSNGGTINFENVLTITSRDIQTKSRVEWGLQLAYKIYLSKWLELQPTVAAGQVTYFPGEYVANRFDEDKVFEHTADPYVEGGFQLEATIGNQKTIFTSISFNKLWWEPEAFFESINQENHETKYETVKLVIGYRIALW